jgi:superfamily II DNA/RNA helicase
LFSEIGIGDCFCNHRDAAERISDTLNEKISTHYHGGMDQDANAPLIQFRNGSVFNHNRFSCSWTDIPEMNHVIHYHLPSKEDEFTIEMVERHVC